MTNVTPDPIAEPAWAAFVAIDWGDRKHSWKLAVAGCGQREQGEIASSPEAVEAWVLGLAARFDSGPIAVILEQSRGPLIYMLTKYAHLVLFPVHCSTAAGYRQTFHPSGSKSDPGDADSLLDLLLRHREEVLHWFAHVNRPMVCAFVERWPTLELLRRAHPGTLRRFFHDNNSRSEKLIETRIAEARAAVAATDDAAVIESESLNALGLVGQITALRAHIDALEKRIRKIVREHPDASLFKSFPGAGDAMAPRLIAAFGNDRTRYASAHEIQCYAGIAPVTESSGRSSWIHFRRACPKFLRQTFQEYAQHSLHKSEWAAAFYQSQREKGKSHHCAVRALAFKWARILFRCWKSRTPYVEALYQRSLRQRHTALKAALGPRTEFRWKSVAGFQKFSANPS